MIMILEKVGIDDLDSLVRLRMDYLHEDHGTISPFKKPI